MEVPEARISITSMMGTVFRAHRSCKAMSLKMLPDSVSTPSLSMGARVRLGCCFRARASSTAADSWGTVSKQTR